MKLWQQVFAVLAPSLLMVAGYPFYKEPLVQAVRSYRAGPVAPAAPPPAVSQRSPVAADSGAIARAAPIQAPLPSRQRLCAVNRRLDLSDRRACGRLPSDVTPAVRIWATDLCGIICPDGHPIPGVGGTGFQMEMNYTAVVPCVTPPVPQIHEEADAAPSEAPIEEDSRVSGGSV